MTRKSKPRRACMLCKPAKYLGNAKDRRPISDRRLTQDPVPRPHRVRAGDE